MKYGADNKPLECMMTNSTCYKGTGKMKVKGVLIHSTGVNNPNLKRYVQPSDGDVHKNELLKIIGKNIYGNDWNHINHNAGVNAWIGKDINGNVMTVQALPWDFKPWGCGRGSKGSCNDAWIQFEICEDGLNDKAYFDKVYNECVELTAYLCNLYNINPSGYTTVNGVKIPNILCHNDSYKIGFGSNHADVNHWFPKFGKSMDTVRNDVVKLLQEDETDGKIYRVQIGAFKVKKNAENLAAELKAKGYQTIVKED